MTNVNELVDIKWNEHSFSIPGEVNDWPVEVTVAYEDGKAATALKLLLGDGQWAEFMKTKPTNRDLGELFNAIAVELGFESAGE